MRRALVTGSAGFIGFHTCKMLLDEGWFVAGYDGFTDYYDVSLKEARHAQLAGYTAFTSKNAMIEDAKTFARFAREANPDVIIHLAAQAGVRYSLENPRAYVDANVLGTFNVMETARELMVDHLLMASTSSVYGANTEMPFAETHKADAPMTIYAATKKATEAMGHAYAHLHDLPTTMFRFFTVYGPWGRPDMAPFKFTKGILAGETIDIYNHGEMWRDFTYVDDLARAIRLLVDAVPKRPVDQNEVTEGDTLSPVAPYRVVNIGNSEKVRLLDFVDAIEAAAGIKSKRNYMDMQPGDVPATWADATLLKNLTGYRPQTNIRSGMSQFVAWYRQFYNV